MDGYESREALIKDHWSRYGFHWDLKKMPRLCLPVRHKFNPYFDTDAANGTSPRIDVLEFSFERGTLEGRPAYRITCEGIVVEEAPLL